MELGHYLALLHAAQADLAAGFRAVADGHPDETEIYYTAGRLASDCDRQAAAMRPFLDRYPTGAGDPAVVPSARLQGPRGPGVGLLRDLADLYLMVAECQICQTVVGRAAQGARDTELQAAISGCQAATGTQLAWLRTQLSQSAVQALVVA